MHIKNLRYFFILPIALSVLSLLAIALWGLKPGIDLAGGSRLQVSYTAGRPDVAQVQNAVSKLGVGEVRVQPIGTDGYVLQERFLTNDEKNTLENSLSHLGQMHEDEFTSVGPALGNELLKKGLIALGLVTLSIILFIAFAFRKVSKPVPSWGYGLTVVAMLAIDLIVPTGFYAVLCHYTGAQVDSLFIVALLAR